MKKVMKMMSVGLVAVCVAGAYTLSARAQEAPAASASAAAPSGPPKTWHKYRKADVQSVMTKVSQDVWHAEYSGASAQHMQQEFLDGQRDYFSGNYDSAMKHFVAAEKISQKYPNDIH